MFLSAIVCWFLGDYLRKRKPRIVIDKATGQEITIDRSNHALFFIPVHYWAPILVIVGIVLCVLDFIK